MRRYQLSGLEHIHLMRHVPRSYDMTRTHILHRGVNKRVDVVLRCSPKNRKKKRVTVVPVRSERKAELAYIRANAVKGYVAVRATSDGLFDDERRRAAVAHEVRYNRISPADRSLLRDMNSQISYMARKSADYIDSQLSGKPEKPVISYPEKTVDSEIQQPSAQPDAPLVTPEVEQILADGGYTLPKDYVSENGPYAQKHIVGDTYQEFRSLMDSLEKSLDEACLRYSVTQPEDHSAQADRDGAADYTLSVNTGHEITNTSAGIPDDADSFKPALSFADGGGHYVPDDDLFDRKLHRPGVHEEPLTPPERFPEEDNFTPFFRDDREQDGQENGFMPFLSEEEDGESVEFAPGAFTPQPEDYPQEDYEQQQVFFPYEDGENTDGQLYQPPQEEEPFAQPTVYADEPGQGQPETFIGFDTAEEETPSFTDDRPSEEEPDDRREDIGTPPLPPEEWQTEEPQPEELPAVEWQTEEPQSEEPQSEEPQSEEPQSEEPQSEEPQPGPSQYDDEDAPMPMIFPDEDEAMPFIFPDEDEDEGYSPHPVSPDRSEPQASDGGSVIGRSGETMYSRSGDQIRKVIGVIRGPSDAPGGRNGYSSPTHDGSVEITFSDKNN